LHPLFIFYVVAHATYPAPGAGTESYPLKGASILPMASGKVDQVHSNQYIFGLEHGGRALIRKGDWKITNIERPFSPGNFNLYNVSQDLADLHDLKASKPEKYSEFMEEWKRFSSDIQVQIPAPVAEE